jgi:hypothetical protein
MKKNKPAPPVIPAPVDVTHINLVLSKLDGLLQAQAHPPSNIDKILAIVTENNGRLIALAHNVGLQADWINNINVRLDHQITLLKHIEKQVLLIERHVIEILAILEDASITDFVLYQIKGDTAMAITGVVVGTTETFQIGFVPSTNFIPLPTPPTVATDDTLVILSPVDLSFQFEAAVDPSDTATTFNVTVSGTNDQGAAVMHTFSIPILPTPPPPAVSITDFSLDQVPTVATPKRR